MPVPPEQTTKQQREARRAEKVALLKKKQARDKRNLILGLVGGGAVVLAVIGLVIAVIAVNAVMLPLIHSAVSRQCASKSPVTPEPAASTSSRQVAWPPWGTSGDIVQS